MFRLEFKERIPKAVQNACRMPLGVWPFVLEMVASNSHQPAGLIPLRNILRLINIINIFCNVSDFNTASYAKSRGNRQLFGIFYRILAVHLIHPIVKLP